MPLRRWLPSVKTLLLALAVLLPATGAGTGASAQTRLAVDISGDGLPDILSVLPTGGDTAVLSIKIGGSGNSASLAIGWCRVCGSAVATIRPPQSRAADIMVLSPDRMTLRWMRWWGGTLIEQKAIPLDQRANAVEPVDDRTVDVRFPNGSGMTVSF